MDSELPLEQLKLKVRGWERSYPVRSSRLGVRCFSDTCEIWFDLKTEAPVDTPDLPSIHFMAVLFRDELTEGDLWDGDWQLGSGPDQANGNDSEAILKFDDAAMDPIILSRGRIRVLDVAGDVYRIELTG